jgi:hypothetical protein
MEKVGRCSDTARRKRVMKVRCRLEFGTILAHALRVTVGVSR